MPHLLEGRTTRAIVPTKNNGGLIDPDQLTPVVPTLSQIPTQTADNRAGQRQSSGTHGTSVRLPDNAIVAHLLRLFEVIAARCSTAQVLQHRFAA